MFCKVWEICKVWHSWTKGRPTEAGDDFHRDAENLLDDESFRMMRFYSKSLFLYSIFFCHFPLLLLSSFQSFFSPSLSPSLHFHFPFFASSLPNLSSLHNNQFFSSEKVFKLSLSLWFLIVLNQPGEPLRDIADIGRLAHLPVTNHCNSKIHLHSLVFDNWTFVYDFLLTCLFTVSSTACSSTGVGGLLSEMTLNVSHFYWRKKIIFEYLLFLIFRYLGPPHMQLGQVAVAAMNLF